MKITRGKLVQLAETILALFIQWRRPILFLVGLALVSVEVSEYGGVYDLFRAHHMIEIIMYVSFILAIGLLLELLLRSMRLQNRTMKIMDNKHKISSEYMQHGDWNSVASQLTKHLAKSIDASEALLFVRDSFTGEFENSSVWLDEDGPTPNQALLSRTICPDCVREAEQNRFEFDICRNRDENTLADTYEVYCLPIYYGNHLYAIIKFRLQRGQMITKDQRRILISIGDDIALTLRATQDRKMLMELQTTEAALTERHNVSQYLHDNLGQNIGYLRMKLDQFASHPELLNAPETPEQILRMKQAAEDSYDAVRSKLESMRPDTLPELTNFLHEHAIKTCQRASLELTFSSKGNPKPIPPDVQRAIFYVFQEIMANIEKHAQANRVDVLLSWSRDRVSLSIMDNGVGFDARGVARDKHFGLGIVHERLANIGGKIEVKSSPNAGTTVKVVAPLSVKQREPFHAN